jgi:inosose dehydratase
MAAGLAAAQSRLPANKNVKWGLSLGLWNYFRPAPFTDVLDVMKDTGFIGIRLTGFPGVLEKYDITAAQMEREVSKRGLHVITISFNGRAQDPSQERRVISDARAAMDFLKIFGAKHLVVFTPSRVKPGADAAAAFDIMCRTFNRIGETAGEMGFQAGIHNHLNQMVQDPEEVDACMAKTDPRLVYFFPDTAHLHLAKCDVVKTMARYKSRITFLDYKDAKWTTPTADFRLQSGRVLPRDSREARFFSSIYDLGDGEIDFPACHRILKDINFRGWICVDLDTARQGPRASFARCGDYVVRRLEPIYL